MTEEKTGAERRAHPRYPMLIKGEAKHANLAIRGAFAVVASNISMGGMVISADSGDIVNVQDVLLLKFPLLHEPPVELQARVVWKREGVEPSIGQWSFGVYFHNSDVYEIIRLHEPARRAFISRLGPETFQD